MKVYKETLYKLEKDKGTTSNKLSVALGYGSSWISQKFNQAKDKGYIDLPKPHIIALCSVLSVTEDELTAIPKSSRLSELDKQNNSSDHAIRELESSMRKCFFMIHEDLEKLISLWEGNEKAESEGDSSEK